MGCARDDPTGYLPCQLASGHMPLNAYLAISGQNSEMDKCGHFGPVDDLLSAWSEEPSRPHRNVLLQHVPRADKEATWLLGTDWMGPYLDVATSGQCRFGLDASLGESGVSHIATTAVHAIAYTSALAYVSVARDRDSETEIVRQRQ